MSAPPAQNSSGIWVVIPVHNRRGTTLRCLERLQEFGLLACWNIVVIDDGSTDGTSAAVRNRFPLVIVLAGDGNLWWAGAIKLGMQHALERGAEFIFWLNDDTLPEPGAMETLLAHARLHNAIVGGVAFHAPSDPVAAYAGFDRGWYGLRPMLQPAKDELRPCAALNGNMVCLPTSIVRHIGLPDSERFPHAFADTDYTLRSHAAGSRVFLAGDCQAVSQPNTGLNYRSWLLSDVPISAFWRNTFYRGSFHHQPAHLVFHWRHWGIPGALYSIGVVLKLALISLIRILVPKTMLRRWWGARSAAWQREAKLTARR